MKELKLVHTIEQWQELTPATQMNILRSIRLKKRLTDWIAEQNSKPKQLEHKVVSCSDCGGSGQITKHARLPGIHASQIGNSCLLKLYKDMEGAEARKVVDPQLQLIFDLGHSVHRMLQNYGLRGAWGPHYNPECRISEDVQERAHQYFLESSADADTILFIDDADPVYNYEVGIIHEYKTINNAGFKTLTSPVPKHKQQATIYQFALNRPITAFLYLNKDNCSVKDFVVGWDPQLWAVTQQKLSTLNRLYEANIVPPGAPGYHCQDCEYSFNCEAYSAKSENREKRMSADLDYSE